MVCCPFQAGDEKRDGPMAVALCVHLGAFWYFITCPYSKSTGFGIDTEKTVFCYVGLRMGPHNFHGLASGYQHFILTYAAVKLDPCRPLSGLV
jgi:hypothetical protein